MKDEKEKKWRTVAVRTETKSKLKIVAAKRGLSMAKMLEEIIETYCPSFPNLK